MFQPNVFCYSLFEYHGENFKLIEVVPSTSIPIPRTIMDRYKKEQNKKVCIQFLSFLLVSKCVHCSIDQERADDRNQPGKEKEDETSVNSRKALVRKNFTLYKTNLTVSFTLKPQEM